MLAGLPARERSGPPGPEYRSVLWPLVGLPSNARADRPRGTAFEEETTGQTHERESGRGPGRSFAALYISTRSRTILTWFEQKCLAWSTVLTVLCKELQKVTNFTGRFFIKQYCTTVPGLVPGPSLKNCNILDYSCCSAGRWREYPCSSQKSRNYAQGPMYRIIINGIYRIFHE